MRLEREERFREAELALGEYLAHRESDSSLSFAAWCADRAHIAPELRELHAECVRIEMLDEGAPGAEARRPALPSPLLARLARRGSTFADDYSIGQTLARGGMGEILAVRDETLRRELAMKVVRGSDSLRPAASELGPARLARFLEEAQVTGQLDHPGIVPVHELGLDSDGRVYFTMKLVRGRDLKEIFALAHRAEEGWNETRALGVILKACEALAYAHRKGVIHRDLKPSNIMVGGFGEVYVMDWGLARVLGTDDLHDLRLRAEQASRVHTERGDERESTPDSPLCTLDGNVLGTPAYMSPEQARGEIERLSPRSDVYAVGAMLYHLLARRMPYEVPGVQPSGRSVLSKVVAGPPTPLHALRRDVPAELAAICEKAMAREPEARYADMLALSEDLRAWLEHRVVAAYQTGALVELRKWVERNKALAAASAAAVVIALSGLGAVGYVEARGRKAADAQRAIAKTNEELAKRNEAAALDQKARADREAEAATKRADEVLRLSALQKLDDLVAEAEGLWPAAPENAKRIEDWIARAENLVRELPDHRAKLAELEARAIPWTEADRVASHASHPKAHELERAKKHLEFLRRRKEVMASDLSPREPTAAEVAPDLADLPHAPEELIGVAWLLVDPERVDFGGEARGLFLARTALTLGPNEAELPVVRHTTAWALYANARFDEALAEEEQALREAPAKARANYEDWLRRLEVRIDKDLDPVGARESDAELANLEASVARLETEVSSRPEAAWRFDSSEDRWWHAQLATLVRRLEELADPRTGLLSDGNSLEHGWGMERRLSFAQTIEERSVSGAEARARWAEALASIQDAAQSPKYAGLDLAPQLGLLPIGPDPNSGLWEFAHLQSGEPAARGPDGKLRLEEGTGLVFVLLPGGTFQMGAQTRDPARPNYDASANTDESPVHAVTLSPFFLSKYEMTQGQWLRFVGQNPSNYTPGDWAESLLNPVEQVSWYTCVKICARLGLLLPSEAQWEYAARAGTTTPWWTGAARDSLIGAANLADQSAKRFGADWVDIRDWPELDDGYPVHAPVDKYRANGFGLHNVHGNVWEWCQDAYDVEFYKRSLAKDPVADPAGSINRVMRGGCFDVGAVSARCSYRDNATPESAGFIAGLRPAMRVAR